jgi:3-deoxy-D-manno-octulosonate 8-phosphate phosphatase (KDO 8-P phosphatase)
MNILSRFKAVRAFIFDMDGVLTDGTLLIMPDGEWVRRMHIRDGYALQLAVKTGYHVSVISGSFSKPVEARLNRLGVTDVFMNAGNKEACLQAYLSAKGLSREEVLYMGDDIPDLRVMKMAGVSCCPSDAATELLEQADHISAFSGGNGCVRDVIEKVLKLNGHWTEGGDTRSL